MTAISPPQNEINSVLTLYFNGQIQEALGAVEILIKSYPNDPVLLNISGACYAGLGQLDLAVKYYEKVLAIKPDYAEAHNNLGVTLQELGQLDAAVKSYEKALAIKLHSSSQDNQIGYAESFNNLGIVLKELGQLQTSINSYEKILAIKPDFAEAHFNLGLTYQELDQRDAAVKSYRKALAIKPDYADAFTNLGFILQEIGQPDEVAKCFEQALAINPDYAEAHNNLGNALSNLGQLDDASKCFEQALAINPDYAEAHNNLGLTLQDLGQLDAALKSYQKAIAIKPDFAEAHRNLGGVLLDLKQLDEAMTSFERALVLNPKLNFLLGHLLHTKMHLSLWDGLSSMLDELKNKINNNEKVTDPFALLGLIDNPELQRKNTEAFASKVYPQSYNLPSIGVYPRHKKIRIGYFSGDFHDHATMHLMAELFECHDKSLFKLIAFSFGPDKKDQWRQRALLCFDKFENVGLKSDREIALLARKMEVDIAIDLKGYTKNSRPKMFAEGCAPIQLSYLGYPGTIAAKYIDYLIADRTLIPEEKKHHYLEKIVYMPNSYQVNMSNREVSKNALIRDELGLPVKGFVFCCFNNAYKITPSTFAGWMRILSAVENSILWLLEGNATHNKNLKNEAIQLGVNEDRIIFAKFMPVEDHLNRIKEADLFIDTLPCNAHTTASDALRMGLPVLTYEGNSFASRVAASLLRAVNLPELITTTQEEYESLAIELAINPEKLKIIKDKLVNNLPTAPLYDTPLFTQHLESAYTIMYDRYQRGLDPDHIYV